MHGRKRDSKELHRIVEQSMGFKIIAWYFQEFHGIAKDSYFGYFSAFSSDEEIKILHEQEFNSPNDMSSRHESLQENDLEWNSSVHCATEYNKISQEEGDPSS